jgi:Flp pilus assembly pilin Flp
LSGDAAQAREVRTMPTFIRQLFQEEEAATSVEYAVVLALIAAAVVASIGTVGTQAGGYWGNIRNQFASFGVGG